MRQSVSASTVLLWLALLSSASAVVNSQEETSTPDHLHPSQDQYQNAVVEAWPPAAAENPSMNDLIKEYDNIFRHGNRNAASHLWSTFLLERAPQMTMNRLEFFFSGFCAVSGSPVRPSDYNRYRLTLPHVASSATNVRGFLHYCCWPCVCDTQDFIRIDTKNVTSISGMSERKYFAVIGNPCKDASKLQEEIEPLRWRRPVKLADVAPEVRCHDNGSLQGATLSDHGYIIISMFFDGQEIDAEEEEEELGGQPQPGRISTEVRQVEVNRESVAGGDTTALATASAMTTRHIQFQDEREYAPWCIERAFNGYDSGMGEIFRRVSAISPIEIPTASVKDHENGLPQPQATYEDPSSMGAPPNEEPTCDETTSSTTSH